MKAKSAPRSGPPVILFPLHGSTDVQLMTAEQHEKRMRECRLSLRKHWSHEGVRSLVTMIELTTARLTAEAIAPESTPHDAGRASGVNEMLNVIRTIITGQEDQV